MGPVRKQKPKVEVSGRQVIGFGQPKVEMAESWHPGSRFEERIKKGLGKHGFRIIEPIGAGGIGSVFKAVSIASPNVENGKTLAIKVLLEEHLRDAETRTRFLMEASLLIGKEHQNLVKIYESGEALGVPFFAMEFLEGTDLCDMVNDNGPLDPFWSLKIIRQVASALAIMHPDIIHRDIKPENILIINSMETAKLIDFGIAKAGHATGVDRLTKPRIVLGTPFFIAPEIFLDNGIDQRSDIYSLGVTLYEMITGSVPFDAKEAGKLLRLQLNEKFVLPSIKNPDAGIPKSVDGMISRCLRNNPDERIQSADDLIKKIDLILENYGFIRGRIANQVPNQEEKDEIGPRVAGDANVQAGPNGQSEKQDDKSGRIDEESMADDKDSLWQEKVEINESSKEARPGFWHRLARIGLIIACTFLGANMPRQAETEAEIYTGRIDSREPGKTVFIEERLPDGTTIERNLGKTPISRSFRGEALIYIEGESGREYYRISRKNRAIEAGL